jgi:hypothetical protein
VSLNHRSRQKETEKNMAEETHVARVMGTDKELFIFVTLDETQSRITKVYYPALTEGEMPAAPGFDGHERTKL